MKRLVNTLDKNSIAITLLWFLCINISNSINAQNMEDFIEHDSFIIVDNPKEVYKSFYKDGMLYEGYFPKGNSEFPRVDYYEKGILKFQYSLDIYQMALNGESEDIDAPIEMTEEEYDAYLKNRYKPKLDIKSIYQNGEIIDGYSYKEIKSGLLTRKIENYRTIALFIDVFAMHFYQRVNIILDGDRIYIKSPTMEMSEENLELQLYREGNTWITKQELNRETIGQYYYVIGEPKNLLPNTTFFIYNQEENTYGYGYKVFENIMGNGMNLMDIDSMYFNNPKMFHTKNMETFFEDFIDSYAVQMSKEEVRPKEPEIYRGYILTNKKGEIIKGIRFFEKEKNTFYEEYKEGNTIKKENISLLNFQDMFKIYMENNR
ncbi:hypothetical protein [Aquimarina litoralis]|uniref:hypothetical protein n=1 Tax=Aquimarina litoralis TaxID=584605 RepID=UPI001C58E33D|nr:hypothetical protein [Aquimarina litoralis]MBW1294580.1 hypothetical protein [Aquimarina litoralis]